VKSASAFDAGGGVLYFFQGTVRAAQGRLNGLIVSHSKLVLFTLYGAFVWARRALNGRNTAVSGPSCRRLFGPRFTYYCKMLLVPVLPY
jgi:hypothetical protein